MRWMLIALLAGCGGTANRNGECAASFLRRGLAQVGALMVALLLLVSGAARADTASIATASLFAASELSLAIDAMQTLQIRRLNDATARSLGCNPCHEINLRGEINPILGRHPSDAVVLGYFGSGMLAQAALYLWGPRWLSNSVSGLTLAIEVPMVAHNFSVGLALRLP